MVVLTDMFGGTPSDLAISIMNGSNIEVIAAVDLPMLIKLASVRETSSLEEVVSRPRMRAADISVLRAGFWALNPIESTCRSMR